MAPYLIRPLFVIATVLVLITALCQVGGRVLFANLGSLEAQLNARLAPRNIQLQGLSGDWRFLNPIVRVAEGRVGGLQLQGFEAELDLLESLARNRIVLRFGQVDEVAATLEQDADGAWRVAGLQRLDNDFDWRSLLWHSDRVNVQAVVQVRAYDVAPSELRLEGRLSNFAGRHKGRIRLTDADGCPQCGLDIEFALQDALLGVRPQSGHVRFGTRQLRLQHSAAALLGMHALQLAALEGNARLDQGRFVGPVQLHGGVFTLPGGEPAQVEFSGFGWVDDALTATQLRLGDLAVEVADGALTLADLRLNYASSETTGPQAQMLLPQLTVDDLTAVLSRLLPAGTPASDWVQRLGVAGAFRNLYVAWDGSAGLGYRVDFDDLNLQNFRGVPVINGLVGRLAGGQRYLRVHLAGANTVIGFPDLFSESQHYKTVTGELLMSFVPGRFGLQGSNLMFDGEQMAASGGFSLASVQPDSDSQIVLALTADARSTAEVTPYIPFSLPEHVLQWLETSQLKANLQGTRFVMHAPLREENSAMGRSYLLDATVDDAQLRFHEDWPRVTEAAGLVKVSQDTIRAVFDSARMAEMRLSQLSVTVPSGAPSVSATGIADLDGTAALKFLRESPLKESLDFIADDWQATGRLRLGLTLDVPLDETTGSGSEPNPRVAVALTGRLNGLNFAMPEAGLDFVNLTGPIAYRYPFEVSSGELSGALFGRPLSLQISSPVLGSGPAIPEAGPGFPHRRIEFNLLGGMSTDALWPLVGLEPTSLASGEFDFSATYSTTTQTASEPVLRVDTTLVGAAVALPAPLGKPAARAAVTAVDVRFGETQQRVQLRYADLVSADLVVRDGEIGGGRMTLGGAPVTPHDDYSVVRIDGALASADVAEWAAGDSQVSLPPYLIENLRVANATVGDLAIADVLLNGSNADDTLQLEFEASDVAGSLLAAGDEVPELSLTRFVYTSQEAEPGAPADGVSIDPLGPEMLDSLQDMRVRIDALTVDGADYGSWQFAIKQQAAGVLFGDLTAQLRALTVTAPEGVLWTRATNSSRLVGSVTAENMADVLTAWGYAPSLESNSMELNVQVLWPGSPLNFELHNMIGGVGIEVLEGRFMDLPSGQNALRMFSLLNFTAIAKRMSGNFSDVFGPGISFDRVAAQVRLDAGMLEFLEPMKVAGTGGEFKVNGTINMVTGALDNEMVVTLPVNKSLPWLGAYLALVNPIAGIGVLVGERILRKPIEGLSSAKYRIGGTLDNPEVKLAGVFDDRFSEKDVPPPAANEIGVVQ